MADRSQTFVFQLTINLTAAKTLTLSTDTPQKRSPACYDLDPQDVEFSSQDVSDFYAAMEACKANPQRIPITGHGVVFED